MIADTNSKLGHILNNINIQDKLTVNPNQPLLLGFLQYSGLTILNSRFCKGVPTYEIIGKKRSVIDLGLTNAPNMVLNFRVEPTPFGVSSQTCHRALTTVLLFNPPKKYVATAKRRTVVGRMTADETEKATNTVSRHIVASGSSSDYTTLLKTFNIVKSAISKKRRKNIGRYTLKNRTMKNLELRFSNAVETLQSEKSQFSLFAVENLEKLLSSHYEIEEKEKTSKWLKKMNDLDFQNRTRTFFSEL